MAKDRATEVVEELLALKEPPDAFFTVSDHQSLGVLEVADSFGIKIPEQLGVFGYANEAFGKIMKPSLSSVNQNGKELGKAAAKIYFKNILSTIKSESFKYQEEIIKSEIIGKAQ